MKRSDCRPKRSAVNCHLLVNCRSKLTSHSTDRRKVIRFSSSLRVTALLSQSASRMAVTDTVRLSGARAGRQRAGAPSGSLHRIRSVTESQGHDRRDVARRDASSQRPLFNVRCKNAINDLIAGRRRTTASVSWAHSAASS